MINSKTILIDHISDNSSNIYEIHANINIRYDNADPGDVEVTEYDLSNKNSVRGFIP